MARKRVDRPLDDFDFNPPGKTAEEMKDIVVAIPTITPEEADRQIAAIRKKYPQLTYLEACELQALRGSAPCSAVAQSSDGGGRLRNFMSRHRLKP